MVKCTSKNGRATVTWAINKIVHKDVRSSDVYVVAIVEPIGEEPWEAFIEDRDVVIKVQVDPIRYDPDEYLRTFPHVNPGSALLGSFAEQGGAIMGKNKGNPCMIVDEKRYTMGFDIEANFFSCPEAMGVFEFRSRSGSRYIHFTVRRTRTHQRNITNANAPNISNVRG
jgi:hypothetical protein